MHIVTGLLLCWTRNAEGLPLGVGCIAAAYAVLFLMPANLTKMRAVNANSAGEKA